MTISSAANTAYFMPDLAFFLRSGRFSTFQNMPENLAAEFSKNLAYFFNFSILFLLQK
jgi:hypothetical protein